jgi:hypothetical protein
MFTTKTRSIYQALLWVQGLYTIATAVWGVIDIESFMAVTGPKTDLWLVKTFSALLFGIGLAMILEAVFLSRAVPLLILFLLNSVVLAFADLYYGLTGEISRAYVVDGVAQVIFALAWLFVLSQLKVMLDSRQGHQGSR